jgi:hypothetical protein
MPKTRSAITVSNTSPPAITDCTREMGASERAAACSPQEPNAITIPSVYQRDRNSISELRTGLRNCTAGAATAPRCL